MGVFANCVILATVFVATESTLECKCPKPVHPQEDFCDVFTDYVIRAKVLTTKQEREVETDSAGMKYHKMKYGVKIASVYKGNRFLKEGENISIYIPPNRCGFELEKNKFYLISGTGTKKVNLKSNVCHWISSMSNLTLHQKLSLSFNRYKRSCNDGCDLNKSGCAFEAGINEDCYDKYATCFRQTEKGNRCAWKYGVKFNKCKIQQIMFHV